MSTLKTGTVQNNTGTGAPLFKNNAGTEIGQLARAWVNFDGSFGTSPFTEANGGIRDSFNVTSITDNGSGDHTINFTNALPNSNFVCLVSTAYDFNHEPRIGAAIAYTTSSVRVETGYSAFNNQDEQVNNVVVFGAS
tara:strand:- start:745 stop:1155 length:411 start_codon:yes stop_codon:yes gene_type:complete